MPHIPKATWAAVFLAAGLLVGVTIGLVFDAGGLERFLEPILVYLSEPEPEPTLVPVDSVAQQVVSEEAIDEIFDEPPKIRIVQLGQQGAPLVRVSDDVWINIESAQGKRIIQEICDRNEGHLGLWIACLKHAPGFANEVATSLRTKPESTAHLGIVRRQQLRDLTR